ncbi:LamB/YcsF family protein [Pectinatus sottacetonis]|uniref:LamB/YcsF family protein n=1 Tax=Pectinatus sottacetonis TaxID=1002795 RepID=UPI0018C45FDA|nr:5-oxoprolinase subunit PxpA [Pectinatus sottacetonis]
MLSVDLNSDLGESFGIYTVGNDEAILKYVSSANIACGFHAGDPHVMHKTVLMAIKNNTAIGAHPGLMDLNGFGRRNMNITAAQAYDITIYQTGALAAFVTACGGHMQHVKPHGALYNMAAKDTMLAEAIAQAVADIDKKLILFGLAGSELIKAGEKAGLKTASEVFADRAYLSDGSLMPRSEPGAVLSDDKAAIRQALQMIKTGTVTASDGKSLTVRADTMCIHGDNAKALIFAQKINAALHEADIKISPFQRQ